VETGTFCLFDIQILKEYFWTIDARPLYHWAEKLLPFEEAELEEKRRKEQEELDAKLKKEQEENEEDEDEDAGDDASFDSSTLKSAGGDNASTANSNVHVDEES
jgi:hypothetical protein